MKFKITRRYKLAVATAILSGGLLHYASSYAALLDIAKIPLFVGSVGVPPNVFITLDDSGSMDWEFTTIKHWQANFYDRDIGNSSSTPTDTFPGSEKRWYGLGSDSGDTAYGQGTASVKFSYYYNNTDNMYGAGCESGDGNGRAIDACNPSFTLFRPNHTNVLWDWRIYSSDLNVLYYNPNANYQPWEAVGTGNASYTNACSNPVWGTTTCRYPRNLSTTDFRYAVWTDDKGFDAANGVPNRGTSIDMTSTSNGYVDLWDTYTLYTVKAGGTNQIDVQTFQTTFCANTTATTTPPRTNDPRCYDGSTYRPGRLLVDQVGATVSLTGSSPHPQLGGRTIAEVKQNIANWYQYYRKRSFVAKGALGEVITTFPNFRYGISVLNQWSGTWPDRLFVQMPPAAQPPYDTHNTDLLQKTYGFKWTSSGTPLQAALNRAGQYYQNTLSGKPTPILSAAAGGQCQQNFSLLTSDGFWNQTFTGSGDVDGDGRSNTLADVAYYYYKTDLSPLDNKVKKSLPFKYADWQNMQTFTVAFGVEGNLNYPPVNDPFWPDEIRPLFEKDVTEKNTLWGDPNASSTTPAKVDDMWHAAYNGRGAFFSARSPDELVTGIRRALDIVSAQQGSAASLSLNSGFVTDTRTATTYQAHFDTRDWIGWLAAIRVSSDGTFETAPVWCTAADATLTGCDTNQHPFASQTPDSRRIFTQTNGAGVEFLWSSLNAAQQSALRKNPITGEQDPEAKGQARLSFLRGKGVAAVDRDWLTANGFRLRRTMLGDIVHSDPFFVDGEPPMVYVGANDGMLHGFNANTGAEVFAYVPNVVFKRLNAIPDLDYAHNYTVDGSAVVRKIGDRKLLVGSLRGGGQGVYALDVTNPGSFSASNVLWEFSDQNDPDLGYTFSKPTIAKMANGKWAVIFGNGYNNTEADGSASSTGNAVLYILTLKDDLKIDTVFKLDTGKGLATSPDGKPNGLATPAVTFDPADPSKTKYIYAGDLQGNLWKFDVSGESGWNVAYGGKPLFTARNAANQIQPITIRPEVDLHPYKGYLVYFGTGKYFETTDNSNVNQPTQTLYVIWDRDDPTNITSLLPQTRAHLLQQEIEAIMNRSYITSNRTLPWHIAPNTNPSDGSTQLGCYIDLVFQGNNQGERQVTNGLLRAKKIFFNTTLPSSDLCDAGGSSNTIVLDAMNCSRLKTSPFTDVPPVTINGNKVPVSSKPSDVGILSPPIVIDRLVPPPEVVPPGGPGTPPPFDPLCALGSTGQTVCDRIPADEEIWGRQSWRQLPQQ
jgi:type IV pilus assembly protein PilY1